MTEKNRTIFCDIDGTIFKYRKFEEIKTTKPELTPGSLEKLKKWKQEKCMIVFTTARPEELRDHTVKELLIAGVPWDKLVMGIERGPRYLINDMDPSKRGLRAVAYNLERDGGLKKIVVGPTEEIVK